MSGEPCSPATVEKRANIGVRVPGWKRPALVNWLTSSVTSKKPWAPLPLAWTTRSGTRSRLKCCIFCTDVVVVQDGRALLADGQRAFGARHGMPESVVVIFFSSLMTLLLLGWLSAAGRVQEGPRRR